MNDEEIWMTTEETGGVSLWEFVGYSVVVVDLVAGATAVLVFFTYLMSGWFPCVP